MSSSSSTAPTAPLSASTETTPHAAAAASTASVAAAPAPGSEKKCSSCGVDRPVAQYSGAQLKKQGKRVCMRCVDAKNPKPVPEGTLPGIRDGGCWLVRTNPNEKNPEAPVVHLYQDEARDQFMIISNPRDPPPTLSEQGHLTYDGVAGVNAAKKPSYVRFPVGHSQYCGRPWCEHWQPSMLLDEESKAHKSTQPEKLIMCEKCKSVCYCSIECLNKHRLTHGLFCVARKPIANSGVKGSKAGGHKNSKSSKASGSEEKMQNANQ